jgi:NADH-quinone oxidoreductase subunit H
LGRSPFDLNEAESEIVAGFHIEYTGMKFGLFYAGELLHALTVSAIFSSLFLGGWRGPFVEQVPILGVVYLFVKAFFIYWVIMWIRYSMPRIRIDHMLGFNWKFLVPLSVAVLLVVAIVDKLVAGYPTWLYTLIMLAANFVVAWVALLIIRSYARRERARVAEPMPLARPAETPSSAS